MVEDMLQLMDELEAATIPRLEEILRRGMLSMVEDFRLTHHSRLPHPQFSAEVIGALNATWIAAIDGGISLFNRHVMGTEPKATEYSELIRTAFWDAHGRSHAEQIVSTTQTQIRNLMAGGLAAGDAASIVYADMMERIPEMALLRATLISRTEIHSATQFATWKMAMRSSLPLVKVWNSVNDDRTRDFGELGKISGFNHRTMNGEKAKLFEPFQVPRIIGGYEPLMFPGDPHGSAGNVINCRCVQTYERA